MFSIRIRFKIIWGVWISLSLVLAPTLAIAGGCGDGGLGKWCRDGSDRTYWNDRQRGALEGRWGWWWGMGEREQKMFPHFYEAGRAGLGFLGRTVFGPWMQRNVWEPMEAVPPEQGCWEPTCGLDNVFGIGSIAVGKFGGKLGSWLARFAGRGPDPADLVGTIPDLHMPLKVRMTHEASAGMARIPKQIVPDVNALKGIKLGHGMEGAVYVYNPDPTKVIKIYKSDFPFPIRDARNQVEGLARWQERIRKVGLEDVIEVNPTLAWGVDEQGRAFTIHPRVEGKIMPADDELFRLKERLLLADPEAVDMYKTADPDLWRMLVMNGSDGNFMRLPNSKIVIIDPQ